MQTEKMTLRNLADTHFAGDSYRALYSVLFTDQWGKVDDYVDEMSQEEAAFVLSAVHLQTVAHYGCEENFQKIVRADKLTQKLGLTEDCDRKAKVAEVTKQLWIDLLKLILVVVIPALAIGYMRRMDMSVKWLVSLESVLIGLFSLNLAEHLLWLSFYKKLEKLEANLPALNPDAPQPTFEACLALCNRTVVPPATPDEAKKVLREASKQNWLGLLMLLPMALLALFGGVVAVGSTVAGIVAATVIFGYAFWQVRKMWRATLKTRDVVKGVSQQDPQWQKLNTRQSLCVLAMLLIDGVYLIAAVAGCMICIGLALNF